MRFAKDEGQIARIEQDFSAGSLPPSFESGFAVPASLQHLVVVIEESRRLLDYEDNWDGEGSPGYQEATWRRAIALMLRSASAAWQADGTRVDAPRISAGPLGSIDIHWTLPQRELLVNVPADPDAAPTFYGDNRAGEFSIKGSLDDARANRWLAVWLSE